MGMAYFDLDLWPGEVSPISRLFELFPDVPEAYNIREDLHLPLRNYKDAINNYNRSAILDHSNCGNIVAKGKTYTVIGDFEPAQNDFNNSIKLDVNSSHAYATRGYLSMLAGDHSISFSD